MLLYFQKRVNYSLPLGALFACDVGFLDAGQQVAPAVQSLKAFKNLRECLRVLSL